MISRFFEKVLEQSLGSTTKLIEYNSVTGGCINSCFRLSTTNGEYFIKYHQLAYLDMFEKEFRGLQALQTTGTLTVPTSISTGTVDERSYLLMEYLNPSAPKNNYWKQLGHGLAKLHQISNDRFGWNEPNYIGRLVQTNQWHEHWHEFFWTQRIISQLQLALENALMDVDQVRQFEKLYVKLNEVLPDEEPALLHGDLWSGNVIVNADGTPALVDPAVYFGHREMELAFTRLFGGFDQQFYLTYEQVAPLSPGFDQRVDLYNLYPLLVHLNLFGSGYLGQVLSVLKRYC